MRVYFFSALAAIAMIVSANQTAISQAGVPALSEKDAKRMAKVKKDVAKIGVEKTITVSRVDNRDFFGRVKSIGTDDFEITETDSGQVQIYKYTDVKNVRQGDGERNLITGKRKNPRYGWLIGLGIVGGAILLTAIGLSQEGR